MFLASAANAVDYKTNKELGEICSTNHSFYEPSECKSGLYCLGHGTTVKTCDYCITEERCDLFAYVFGYLPLQGKDGSSILNEARCTLYFAGTCLNDNLNNSQIDFVQEYEELNKTPTYGEPINDFNIKISDFFGDCDYVKVEDYDLTEMGMCVNNLITPSIKIEMLFLPFSKFVSDLGGLDIAAPINLIINFLLTMVRFILHFIFRFAVVYLLWISLGFQVLVGYIDRNKVLEHQDKVYYSFILMVLATLYTMVNGLGVAA